MRRLSTERLGKRIDNDDNRITNWLSSIYKNISTRFKKRFVYGLFWGRSNLYRNIIHVTVLIVTTVLFVSGFTNRFLNPAQANSSIDVDAVTSGNIDLLEQGSNIQSILVAESTRNFKVIKHTVQEGDTYDSIAAKYGIEAESLRLTNMEVSDYYADKPKVGIELEVPEINGILIKINEGDTIDSLMGFLKKGQRLDIIEINNLKAPDYKLPVGQKVLVPDGRISPPAKPVPVVPDYVYTPRPGDGAPVPTPIPSALEGIAFVDPLSHPSCAGYGYSRGYSSWHNGVDLPRRGGCVIRAAAAGTVDFAGWSPGGEGYMVRINHTGGVKTLYFHGDGQIWVTPGQYVAAGTDIMYMGCTGYCTGTHLHFSLKIGGYWIDPAPYVPYYKPW